MSYKNEIKHPLWQRKRLEIMQRDNFECQICKSKENSLNVHHIYYLPNTKIWEYDNEGLTTICEKCHSKITFDLAKISGIISFKIIQKNIDVIQLYNIIKNL